MRAPFGWVVCRSGSDVPCYPVVFTSSEDAYEAAIDLAMLWCIDTCYRPATEQEMDDYVAGAVWVGGEP